MPFEVFDSENSASNMDVMFLLCTHEIQVKVSFWRIMTHFRGGKSTEFGLIYDTVENAKKFVRQNGLDTKIERSRKQIKERMNMAKKIRGVKRPRLEMLPRRSEGLEREFSISYFGYFGLLDSFLLGESSGKVLHFLFHLLLF